MITLAVAACGWIALGFADWLFGFGTGPDERGWFRNLLPLLLFLPVFYRWFHPSRRPADHQEAYRLHSGLIVATLVSLGILIFFSFLPFSFNEMDGPEDFGTFVLARLAGLVVFCSVAFLTERLLLLFSYGSRLSQKVLNLLRYGLILSLLFVVLVPEPAGYIIGATISAILSFGLFFLGLRSGWVVHVWRDQKYRMLGLSFVGVIAGTGLSLVREPYLSLLLEGISPLLDMLLIIFSGLIISAEIGLFIRILLTLPTAGAMDRRNIEVSSLSNFGRLMVDSFDMNALMKASVSIACDVTSGRSAWIILHDEGNHEIVTGGKVPLSIKEIERLLHVRNNNRYIEDLSGEKGKIVRVFDFTLNGNGETEHGQKGHPLSGSLAIVPLRNSEGERGKLYVIKGRRNGFDRDDTTILETVATQIALAMDHAALIRKSIERERLRNEMLIAREAQQRLLPVSMPGGDHYELYAESEPASMVGGDYFDSVIFRDGTKGALIADVSGKGAGAALYMGMVKGVIRALSGLCADPAELLTRANSALYRNIDPRFFVTMTCLRILEGEQKVQIARAGHCPTLILRRDGKATYHTPQGIGLALTSTKQFQRALLQENIGCSDGDIILMFSDGLAEARKENGDELGFERFRRLVEEAGKDTTKMTLRELRDAIFTGISTFTENAPPVDDSTLVILRWHASSRRDRGTEASYTGH